MGPSSGLNGPVDPEDGFSRLNSPLHGLRRFVVSPEVMQVPLVAAVAPLVPQTATQMGMRSSDHWQIKKDGLILRGAYPKIFQ